MVVHLLRIGEICKNYDRKKYINTFYMFNATAEIGSVEYNLLSFRDRIAKIFTHRKYPLYDIL